MMLNIRIDLPRAFFQVGSDYCLRNHSWLSMVYVPAGRGVRDYFKSTPDQARRLRCSRMHLGRRYPDMRPLPATQFNGF